MANLTGKKISETELTNTIENNDLIPLIQEGINKVIEFSDVLKQIAQQIITNNEDDSSTDKAASAKLLNDLSASLNNINNNLVSRIDDIETNIDNINNRDIRSDWNETNSSSVKYIQNKPISLQGKSAYQVAVENGFVGTEDQWLVSLKGAKGDTGAKGDPGFNGTSTYFHVRYSVNSNGNPIQSTPAKYIGTVVTNSSLPPTNYTQYTWYDWEGAQGPNGEQGIPGVNGSNGQTSYLHIKYSDNGGLTFTSSNGETPGDWLGQYVDFNLIDSLNVNDYTWSKIKGLNGIDGKSTEFIFTTTNTSTSPAQPTTSQIDDYVPIGWTDDPTGVTQARPYEWVCQRTKTNGIWSQFSTPAIWAKFGLDGSKGDSADWISFVFKQADTQPTTPTGTAIIPTGWVDAPSNIGIWWMSKSTVSGTTGLASTWSTPVKVTGVDGASARTVDLTASVNAITYNSAGITPNPTTVTITATATGTSGTPYYQFLLNDTSVQNTTSATYTYTPQASFTNMPDKIEVRLREGSTSSTILARDQISMVGMKSGSPSITAILSNEAHSLPASNAGVVSSYTGSGTTINVYQGSDPILYDGVGTTNNSFKVVTTGTNITAGSLTDSGSYCTVGVASAMSSANSTAYITYTITGVTSAGVSFSITKIQNFTKSLAGATGSNGANGADGSYVVYQFAKNTSSTTAPTIGWSSTPPTLSTGEYCWMRYGTVVPPATTPASWSSAVRISGEKGNTGDTGPMGSSGPMLLARGLYSSSETYTGNSTIRQAVKWNDGTQDFWYLTLPTAGQFSNIAPSNSLYWEPFTQNIDFIATKLLLAEGANIAGWVFHVDGSGNQMLQSQNNSAVLNGTTGAISIANSKIVFNQDGSGYLANNRFFWNSLGELFILANQPYGIKIHAPAPSDPFPYVNIHAGGIEMKQADGGGNNSYISNSGISVSSSTCQFAAYVGNPDGKLKLNFKNLPQSASGLVDGDIWNDSGTLKIIVS